VTFQSPGTFVGEETTKPIKKWDHKLAFEMSKEIKERYGAIPFAFYFTTRERSVKDLDSKVTKRSGHYYIGGKIRTIQDVEKDNNPDEKILLSNMKNNDFKRIHQTTKGWKWTSPLRENDKVLDKKGNIIE